MSKNKTKHKNISPYMTRQGAVAVKMRRRDFLKLAALTTMSIALAELGSGKIALSTLKPLKESSMQGPSKLERLQKKYFKCGICGAGCVLVGYVDPDIGRIVKIEGDPRDYVSHGTPCVKGKSSHLIFYDPERLKAPMKRTNPDRGFVLDENSVVIGVKDPKWEEISWEQALDEIADKVAEAIKTEGPQSIVFIGHGKFTELASIIGTPNNIKHHSTCHSTWEASIKPMFGGALPVGELSHAKLIVSFGFDQPGGKSKNPFVWQFAEAKRRGAYIIVFEPRLSGTANKADEWIPIKPGTDAAVAMAIANVIIEERLYDAAFLKKYTNAPLLIDVSTGEYPRDSDGKAMLLVYDEFAKEVRPLSEAVSPALFWEGEYEGMRLKTAFQLIRESLKDKTPEWAEKISGVPAGKIREIARLLATVKPACIPHWKRSGGVGPGKRQGTETLKVVSIIMAMTGNLERLGGWIINRNAKGAISKAVSRKAKKSFAELYPIPEQYKGKTIDEREKFPLYKKYVNEGAYQNIWYNILNDKPYKVKVIFITGQGLQAMMNYEIIEKAIKHVVEDNGGIVVNVNIYPDDTAALADYVLPEKWFFASKGIGYSKSLDLTARINWIDGISDPAEKARSSGWIQKELAIRIGKKLGLDEESIVNEYLPESLVLSSKEKWEKQIAKYNKKYKTNITLEELQKKKVISLEWKPADLTKLKTVSGRVEIYPVEAKKYGYNPLPEWRDYFTANPSNGELYMVSSVSPMNRHSKTVNNKWLLEFLRIYHMDKIWVHPSVAEKLGLKEDDWVMLEVTRTYAGDRGNVLTVLSGYRIKGRVHITEAIRPDCVFVPHGTGQLAKWLRSHGFGPLGGDGAVKPVMVDYEDPSASSIDMDVFVKITKL